MPNERTRCSRQVMASIHDGGVVLLHTVTGQMFAANRVGAQIWDGLSQGLPIHSIAAQIGRDYRIPLATAQDDVLRFLADLGRQKLIESEDRLVSRIRYAWLVCRALYELVRYDALRAVLGFSWIHRRLGRQAVNSRATGATTADHVCEAVRLACCLYVKRVLCLQRSVCVVRLLRCYGVAARLVVGYRTMPFFCHAWAEVDGRVVNDSAAYQERLSVLYTG